LSHPSQWCKEYLVAFAFTAYVGKIIFDGPKYQHDADLRHPLKVS
jgi:hypothetical protein